MDKVGHIQERRNNWRNAEESVRESKVGATKSQETQTAAKSRGKKCKQSNANKVLGMRVFSARRAKEAASVWCWNRDWKLPSQWDGLLLLLLLARGCACLQFKLSLKVGYSAATAAAAFVKVHLKLITFQWFESGKYEQISSFFVSGTFTEDCFYWQQW